MIEATIETVDTLKEFIIKCLEDKKAEEITIIDLKKHNSIAEYIILANGRSTKNVGAIAEYVALELKHHSNINTTIEGLNNSEWVLIDAGSILINIFYPETREHFRLEEMWRKR